VTGRKDICLKESEESKVFVVCGGTVDMMQSEGVYSTLEMATGRISDDAKQAAAITAYNYSVVLYMTLRSSGGKTV
jgi:hypothetical protein